MLRVRPLKHLDLAAGRAAIFAPNAVAFIQSLPDDRKSIKTTRSGDGKIKEANSNLGAVSKVRSKIAKACDELMDQWTGRQARLIAKKDVKST
jgi:hypothetical protein